MVDLGVDEVLVVDVVDLLGLDDVSLVEQLEGVVLSRLFVFGDLHLSETTCVSYSLTFAECPTNFVVFELHLLDGLAFLLLHVDLNYRKSWIPNSNVTKT